MSCELQEWLDKAAELSTTNKKLINKVDKAALLTAVKSHNVSHKMSDTETKDKFDTTLHKKIEKVLRKLYPEIKLEYTENEIQYVDSDGNVMNQEEASNLVNYTLKVVDTLYDIGTPKKSKHGGTSQAVRSTIKLNTKENPNIEKNLNKYLAGKGIPKEQIGYMFEYMRQNDIAEIGTLDLAEKLLAGLSQSVEVNVTREDPVTFEDIISIDRKTAKKRVSGKIYTIDKSSTLGKFGYKYYIDLEKVSKKEFKDSLEKSNKNLDSSRYYDSLVAPDGTKYREIEIRTPAVKAELKGHAKFATDEGIGWYRVDDDYDLRNKDKTLRVLEMQSDMFQKMKDTDLAKNKKASSSVYEMSLERLENAQAKLDNAESEVDKIVAERWLKAAKDSHSKLKKPSNKNLDKAFHQVLNTDNKWVKFFIQSIIQNAERNGYKKIRFPAGETAARIEGHESIAEQIKHQETRINRLQKEEITKEIKDGPFKGWYFYDNSHYYTYEEANADKQDAILTAQEQKQRLKTEGVEKLAPIEGFYQVRVQNTLKKMYGKDKIKTVTDEHGNAWFELELDNERDSQAIMLQKVEHNESEIADVAGLMRELGYNTKGQLERDVTVNEILDNQIKILEDLKTKGTSNIAEVIDWIDTSKHKDSADRAGRGRKHALKYGTGKSKYAGEEGQIAPTEAEQRKHLEMQVAEELLEVIEEKGNIPNTVEKMLEQQKRAFKSLRFLGDTVNKDSGLTNDQQLKKELVSTKYEKERISTDNDKYKLIQKIAQDIKTELGHTVVLQKQNGRIKGQANIEAKTVLINSLLQSQDTLPHEYAHHYIAWFRDTPIVQEAIKKWSSEEALVQAIGEQVVKQKGEAWNWWKKFTQWLQDKFDKLSSKDKEELKNILTDAFLTRQDLGAIKVPSSTASRPKNNSGFQGYIGGFDSKGKGTPQGDGKDKAMREVADGFIGEITTVPGKDGSPILNKNSSTYTSAKNKEVDLRIYPGEGFAPISTNEERGVTMLARNGERKNKPLSDYTKENILNMYKKGNSFVVGDMPGVDNQFIDYLDEIGANYKIYHTGNTPRIKKIIEDTKVPGLIQNANEIYKKLGHKTKTSGTVLNNVYQKNGIQYAKSIGGIFSLRVNNSHKHFGNPFSSVKSEIAKGLIPTSSIKESVLKYIEWILSDTTDINPEQHTWIKEQLASGNLKGKPIVYYKELGEPSHATALAYLINNFDGTELNDILDQASSAITRPDKITNSKNIKKLVWLNGDKNSPLTIDDGTKVRKTKVEVTSLNELINLSEQYQAAMIARDKSVKLTKAHEKHFKDLFKMLESYGIQFKPVTVEFAKKLPNNVVGQYLTNTNKILLTTNNYGDTPASPIKVVLHEYVHRITTEALAKNPEIKDKLLKVREHVLKHVSKEDKKLYGFSDEQGEVSEFVAEVMSSPKFQHLLNGIPPYENKSVIPMIKTMFKKLLTLLTRDKNVEASALTESLQLVYDLTIKAEESTDTNERLNKILNYGVGDENAKDVEEYTQRKQNKVNEVAKENAESVRQRLGNKIVINGTTYGIKSVQVDPTNWDTKITLDDFKNYTFSQGSNTSRATKTTANVVETRGLANITNDFNTDVSVSTVEFDNLVDSIIDDIEGCANA